MLEERWRAILTIWIAIRQSAYTIPALLLIIAAVVAMLFVAISTTRTLTPLEGVLLQIFVLFLGIAGSFSFGRQSARDAAREIIRPSARSAFRRLVSIYRSLSRAATAMQDCESKGNIEDHRVAFAIVNAIVTEQLFTADDAMNDWMDIVPEEVSELKRAISASRDGVSDE